MQRLYQSLLSNWLFIIIVLCLRTNWYHVFWLYHIAVILLDLRWLPDLKLKLLRNLACLLYTNRPG